MEHQHEEHHHGEERPCFCKSKGFRKFLIVALGSFVGVFFALSLFAAVHKPPCPMREMHPPIQKHCDCARHQQGPRGEFQKRIQPPADFQKPPVKVQENLKK